MATRITLLLQNYRIILSFTELYYHSCFAQLAHLNVNSSVSKLKLCLNKLHLRMSILVATTRSPFFPLNGWECNGTRSMEISIHIAQWTISRDHNQPIKWLLFNIVLYKFRL